MRSLSSSIGLACNVFQRGLAAQRRRELPPVLRTGLRRLAARYGVEHLVERFRGEVFVSVPADQHHRGVDAGAEALHLLPGEITIRGDMERLMVDAALADLLDVL